MKDEKRVKLFLEYINKLIKTYPPIKYTDVQLVVNTLEWVLEDEKE